MKIWMTSIFSIIVMIFSLTGCGEEGSMSVNSLSTNDSSTIQQQNIAPSISETDLENGNNGYGISDELGTPPELPFG